VADGIDVTRAEFEYAVTHEGALTVDDILDRRTRIGLVETDRARAAAVAAELLTRCSR
jgi:glycerol-3-phosphate dehydrogenase